MKLARNNIIALVIAGTFILGGLMFSRETYSVGLPFGGFVSSSYYCNCSFNFLLTFTPAAMPPGTFQLMYQTGTPQYPNFQLPRPGVWALGLYSPGGTCLQWAGKICVPIGLPIGTITPTVGTSL